MEVPGGVAGTDGEGVRAIGKMRDGLRRAATRITAGVELALKAGPGLGGGEGEGGGGVVGRAGRAGGDRRVGRCRVEREAARVGGWVGVLPRVGGLNLERVGAVGEGGRRSMGVTRAPERREGIGFE